MLRIIILLSTWIAIASPLGGNIQNRANDGNFSQCLRTINEKIDGALVGAKAAHTERKL